MVFFYRDRYIVMRVIDYDGNIIEWDVYMDGPYTETADHLFRLFVGRDQNNLKKVWLVALDKLGQPKSFAREGEENHIYSMIDGQIKMNRTKWLVHEPTRSMTQYALHEALQSAKQECDYAVVDIHPIAA